MLNKLNPKFLERLNLIYTKEELEIVKSSFLLLNKKTTFRVNTLKSSNEEIENILKENNIAFEKVWFLSNWYVLVWSKEKDLWNLDIYKNWNIYLQWLTSQIPVEIIDLEPWFNVLDLTSAPWSKTSQISAKLQNTWKIFANELSSVRREKLKYTIEKQWCKNVEIIWKDATKKVIEKDMFFDVILLDAPCSSEWKINLNKEKIWNNWTLGNISRNYKIQKEILKNNISLLKQWWQLIYSTCTLAPEENEAIVHFLLCNYKDLEIVDINLNFLNDFRFKAWITRFWDVVYKKDVSKSLRILPSESTEWFFVAKFKKI